MTRKQKHLLTRILVAAVLFLAGSLLHLPEYVEMGVFLVCYAVVGWDIVWKAITNILHGQVFDENFLMTIATIGALILGEHSEGVAVMLFYQVGEWFQSYAVSKSRKSIASLMDIRPDYANVEQDGKLVQVDPDEVQIGSVIVVKPGERIPLDGTIIKGSSALDTSALTGESMPREVEPGMEVISGCINQTGILTIQTTKEFGESTVAKILDLVENASDKKGKTENFITRFARYYTPAVVFAALALAVLPPLITGQAFGVWIYRALTFLVISCPCALVISIPLSFFGGIGGASKIGVLVKGSNYLESLAHAEVVVFDKTGTLTKGSFVVSEIHPNGMKEEKLLELAAYAEDYSNHPISLSIKKAYGKKIDNSRIGIVKLGHAAFIPGTVSGLDRDLLIIVRIIFQANIQSAIIQLGKGITADVDFIHAGKVIACFHTEQLALNPRTDRRGFPVKDLNVTVLGVGLPVFIGHGHINSAVFGDFQGYLVFIHQIVR